MEQFFAMAHKQPLAYHDETFLDSTDARPIRILAEYLDPLRRFREENIQDTVVFFGSARVHSRQKAERALLRLTNAGARKRARSRRGAQAEPEGGGVVALLRGRASAWRTA